MGDGMRGAKKRSAGTSGAITTIIVIVGGSALRLLKGEVCGALYTSGGNLGRNANSKVHAELDFTPFQCCSPHTACSHTGSPSTNEIDCRGTSALTSRVENINLFSGTSKPLHGDVEL